MGDGSELARYGGGSDRAEMVPASPSGIVPSGSQPSDMVHVPRSGGTAEPASPAGPPSPSLPSWGPIYLDDPNEHNLGPKMDLLKRVATRIRSDMLGFFHAIVVSASRDIPEEDPTKKDRVAAIGDMMKFRLSVSDDFCDLITRVVNRVGTEPDLLRLKSEWFPFANGMKMLDREADRVATSEASRKNFEKWRLSDTAAAMSAAWAELEQPITTARAEARKSIAWGIGIGAVGAALGPVGMLAAAGLIMYLNTKKEDRARASDKLAARFNDKGVKVDYVAPPMFGGASGSASSGQGASYEGGATSSTLPAGSQAQMSGGGSSPLLGDGGGVRVPPRQPVTPTPMAEIFRTSPRTSGELSTSSPVGSVIRPTRSRGFEGRGSVVEDATIVDADVPSPRSRGFSGDSGYGSRGSSGGTSEQPFSSPTGAFVRTEKEPTLVKFPDSMMGQHGVKCDILASLKEFEASKPPSVAGAAGDVGDEGESGGRGGSRRAGGAIGRAAGKASSFLKSPVGSGGVGRVAGQAAMITGAGVVGWKAGSALRESGLIGLSDEQIDARGDKRRASDAAKFAEQSKAEGREYFEKQGGDAALRKQIEETSDPAKKAKLQRIIETKGESTYMRSSESERKAEAAIKEKMSAPAPTAPVKEPEPSVVVVQGGSGGGGGGSMFQHMMAVPDPLIDALNYGRLTISLN